MNYFRWLDAIKADAHARLHNAKLYVRTYIHTYVRYAPQPTRIAVFTLFPRYHPLFSALFSLCSFRAPCISPSLCLPLSSFRLTSRLRASGDTGAARSSVLTRGQVHTHTHDYRTASRASLSAQLVYSRRETTHCLSRAREEAEAGRALREEGLYF